MKIKRLIADMESAGVKQIHISDGGLIYAKTKFDPWGVRPSIRENGVFRDATQDEIARDMKENGAPPIRPTDGEIRALLRNMPEV